MDKAEGLHARGWERRPRPISSLAQVHSCPQPHLLGSRGRKRVTEWDSHHPPAPLVMCPPADSRSQHTGMKKTSKDMCTRTRAPTPACMVLWAHLGRPYSKPAWTPDPMPDVLDGLRPSLRVRSGAGDRGLGVSADQPC